MTTIAALAHDGIVAIAADTVSVDGTGRRWHGRQKISRRPVGDAGEVLLASCGPVALASLLRHDLAIDGAPAPDDDDDCDRWAHAIAAALSSILAEARPPITEDDGHLAGGVVLGHAGRLWWIHEHHAGRITEQVFAVGSGGNLALGALAAMYPDVKDGRIEAVEALVAAVRIAERWDDATGGPAQVELLTPTVEAAGGRPGIG